MRLLRTSTFQITVLYAVMLAISTAAVALFLYWSTIGFLQRQTDQAIEIEIAGLRETYRTQGLNGLSRVIGDRIRTGDDAEAIYMFADNRLQPLAGNLEAWPLLVATEEGWYRFQLESNGQRTTARARVLQLREGLVLLVGRDISDLNRLLTLAGGALFWSAGLMIALAMVGGVFMSRRVLGRIENINETTRRIINGDFSQRVTTRGTRDEYDQLADNLNEMLERIEALMSDMRHVGDSIAHDLRTPLTRLRQALEATAETHDADEMREGIGAAIDDTDRLLSTFSALLRIARLESGAIRIRNDVVHLPELVSDALELYSVMAEERNIRITTELATDSRVMGDRDLVFQLIVNLLDNAIKYTPAGGCIRVCLVSGEQSVVLSVADTGPGIPADQLDKVTHRFYRVDASRHRAGSGLGLSLVRAVAEHHGAELRLSNLSPGLKVQVRFPCTG
ncbi:MAG TPA: HAMP domain-containing sensor histidine kinase [Woeseiaceae bacterium]|nr:HAMP domain-containing sensor histidine kinase [Woeseiaceae bacterium]